MLSNIKAVLFDLDGTLIDSMHVWKQIDIDFMTERGLELNTEEYQRSIEGMSMTETAVYTIENFHLENEYTVESLTQHWNDMAFEMYKNKVELKAGVVEFLSYLKANGIKTAICSSNSYYLVETVLKAREIDKYIDIIFTCNEVGKGKPAPDVYLAAASKLEVEPANCLVFEDVVFGIMAGNAANMTTCAIWDEHSAYSWDEKVALSDYNFNNFNEVLEVCNA